MNNVVYKDDEEYPELLRQMGKDAPKQLYFKGNWSLPLRARTSEFSERFTLKGSDASQKIQNARSDRSSSVLQKVNFSESLSPPQQAGEHVHTYDSEKLLSLQKFKEPSIFENCLAVIGSRRLTHYGKQAMERLVGEIAMNNITIVSGFMYGGDAIAHKTTIEAGGRTIAVMPCGIDKIHPEDQEDLYNEILENNGLIISEYEGDMGPALWTYPQRNRIVAGLSKALLVVEAGEKSGCLITANCAKKFNRKIFAVPGPITSSVSVGTNGLIKEGAEMVLSAKDVLGYYRSLDSYSKIVSFDHSKSPPCHSEAKPKNLRSFANAQDDNKNAQDDKGFEKKIIELLEREPMGVDEMSRNLEMPVSELGVKLSMIEMKGLIEMKGNKYYNK
ncbi:DNA-processing protein DprA [Patescibacteria group bacterium]|nr:DNA-processing protein DprA [Patescibacteria group bacterium]